MGVGAPKLPPRLILNRGAPRKRHLMYGNPPYRIQSLGSGASPVTRVAITLPTASASESFFACLFRTDGIKKDHGNSEDSDFRVQIGGILESAKLEALGGSTEDRDTILHSLKTTCK